MVQLLLKLSKKSSLLMLVVLTMLAVCKPLAVSAQEAGMEPKIIEKADGKYQKLEECFTMHFQNAKTAFDPDYMENSSELARLRAFIDSIDNEMIEKVEMYSYASPEGQYEYNIMLSNGRSNTMKAYMEANFNDIFSKLTVDPKGESWDALREYVEKDQVLKEKDKAALLKVIDNDSDIVSRKKALESSAYFGYLYRYFRVIRNTGIRVVFLKKISDNPQPVANAQAEMQNDGTEQEAQPLDIVVNQNEQAPAQLNLIVAQELQPQEDTVKAKETIFKLKTNLLYDVVTMVNAEIEFPIKKRFSIAVEDVFPWWEFKPNKYALQNWEMGVEGRFWLKPWEYDTDKLRGHFFGVYGMSGRGDLQLDTKPNYQARYWSAGLTYGYVIPLGKKHWGNMEFSLSAGFLRADYQHYWPSANYDQLIRDPEGSGKFSYFGPTKAKISLVIPINFNTKRAGKYAQSKLKEAASDNE